MNYSSFIKALQDPRSTWEEVEQALQKLGSLLPFFWSFSVTKKIVIRAFEENEVSRLISLGWDDEKPFYMYSGKEFQTRWVNQCLEKTKSEEILKKELNALHAKGLQGKCVCWADFFASQSHMKALEYVWNKQPPSYFKNAWFVALRTEQKPVVEFFLNQGIEPDEWQSGSQEKSLCLIGSEDQSNTIEIAKILIEKGANPLLGGETSFVSRVIQNQAIGLLRVILSSPLFQNSKGLNGLLSHVVSLNHTQYHIPEKLIEYLLKKGADPFSLESRVGPYPTTAAFWKSSIEKSSPNPNSYLYKTSKQLEKLLGQAKSLKEQRELQHSTSNIQNPTSSLVSSSRSSRL